MNKSRRKRIIDIIMLVDDFSDVWNTDERRSKIEHIISEVTDCREDEEMAMDSMPENLQGSFRYEAMQEAVDGMDEVLSTLDDIQDLAKRKKRAWDEVEDLFQDVSSQLEEIISA